MRPLFLSVWIPIIECNVIKLSFPFPLSRELDRVFEKVIPFT